jgi:hypothetical protein
MRRAMRGVPLEAHVYARSYSGRRTRLAVGASDPGHQQARAGVEPECARMRSANIGVLNCGRLAGLLIDGKHGDDTFGERDQSK